MIQSVKELIVVLAIAMAIFRFAKPIALRFSAESDFLRRRNVWFALTIIAFLSPNFWLFALVAAPLYTWAGRKDTNPVALYLLVLHVVPPIAIPIPVPGINELFDLSNYRLLSFCVLIPAAWRLRRSKDVQRIPRLQAMDYLLLAYGCVQMIIFVPPDLPGHLLIHDSPTNVLRRDVLFFVDTYFLYFVVSRQCSNRHAIVEAQAALCISCAVMAAVAVFENTRNWLVYVDMVIRWTHDPKQGFYLFRGSWLRAEASAGPPLVLAYLLAIGFGFWLNLKSQVESKRTRIGVLILLSLGLLAAYSRGPWFGTLVIYLIFLAIGPRAFSRMAKAAALAAILIGVISVLPVGERIISVLPFAGGYVDNANITYRHHLAQRSWELIKEHPFFGDQMAYFKMEDLRQGMGIIDFVNTYAEVTLFYGLVGLSLFAGFIFTGLSKAYRSAKQMATSDPDFAQLGFSLVACIVGTLLMLVSASLIDGYQVISYVLMGLAAAYANLSRTPRPRTPVPHSAAMLRKAL